MIKPDQNRPESISLRRLFEQATVPTCTPIHEDIRISALIDDSRQVGPGACFVAVRGVQADGHRYLAPAIAAGATAIVVESGIVVPATVTQVVVPDTRVAVAKLAAAFHGLCGAGSRLPRLIGVTGTNGKTTIAWMLQSVLNAAGRRSGLLGTIAYDLLNERRHAPLTTPGPVELCHMVATARDSGATDVVMEVSSHALEQHRTDGLAYSAGIFTNLTGDHLDYHGTMEAYAAAKKRLFANLDADAVAVVNAEDACADFMVGGTKARVVRYGMDADRMDVAGRNVTLNSQGLMVHVVGRTFESMMRCSLVGRHNVLNVLAVAATAEALGIPAAAIRDGLERLSGVPGRLQRVEPDGYPFSVYVDYAHTDDALRNVLTTIRPLTSGKVICVFGCGGDRDRTKRPRMAAVVGSLADVAFVTSDNPRSEEPMGIIGEILPGFGSASPCRVAVEPDRRLAIEYAIAAARSGDTVLIAGKGHEDYQLIGDRVLDFDDANVARTALGIACGATSPAVLQGIG